MCLFEVLHLYHWAWVLLYELTEMCIDVVQVEHHWPGKISILYSVFALRPETKHIRHVEEGRCIISDVIGIHSNRGLPQEGDHTCERKRCQSAIHYLTLSILQSSPPSILEYYIPLELWFHSKGMEQGWLGIWRGKARSSLSIHMKQISCGPVIEWKQTYNEAQSLFSMVRRSIIATSTNFCFQNGCLYPRIGYGRISRPRWVPH